MNIRQLSYFCSAAETGSFSRAASNAGVSVQAVSKAIGELEEELGGPLFVRGSTGSQLTTLGRALMPYAAKTLVSFQRVEHFAKEATDRPAPRSSTESLEVVIAAPAFVSHKLFCSALGRAFSMHLKFPIHFDIKPEAEAVLGLFAGFFDIMITVGPYENDCCDIRPVGRLTTAAFFARNHPLAKSSSVHIAELSAYPLLCAPHIESFNRAVVTPYEQAGLTSPHLTVLDDDSYRHALFEQHAYSIGLGVELFSTPGIAEMHPIDESERISIPLTRVILNTTASPLVSRFDRLVHDRFAGILGLLDRQAR